MVEQHEIDAFLHALTTARAAHTQANFPSLDAPTFSAERGQKYIRIVVEKPQRSVFCFVDAQTGDILKAAGWKTPAKGARGHIRNGAKDVTPYGAVYKVGCYMDTFGQLGLA
jgi:hypothetical protein